MPEFDPKTRELLIGMLLLAGLLVVVALGIQVITIFRRRMLGRSGDSRADLAESFREAYEAGEIGTDEYRQIRATIDRGPPAPPPRAAPPAPAPERVEPANGLGREEERSSQAPAPESAPEPGADDGPRPG